MDGAAGDILEQFARLLISWGAVPWWSIVLLGFVISVALVGKERGWWHGGPVPPPPIPDVPSAPEPNAQWSDNVRPEPPPDKWPEG